MSEVKERAGVRLRAEDVEDLAVMAALLQDARVALREMVFDPEEKHFIAAFTRYRRELQDDPESCVGLTETGVALRFGCITQVKHRHLDPDEFERQLTLLTIATEPGERQLFHIDLVFEGGPEIQLRTDCIDVLLEDFGEPRPCRVSPCDHFANELGRAAKG